MNRRGDVNKKMLSENLGAIRTPERHFAPFVRCPEFPPALGRRVSRPRILVYRNCSCLNSVGLVASFSSVRPAGDMIFMRAVAGTNS